MSAIGLLRQRLLVAELCLTSAMQEPLRTAIDVIKNQPAIADAYGILASAFI